jgi:hypothetical protein
MVVNIGVSWQWKVLTFKGTHLIERMTLLTLYICNASIALYANDLADFFLVGEGVIDVLKSVAKVCDINFPYLYPADTFRSLKARRAGRQRILALFSVLSPQL